MLLAEAGCVFMAFILYISGVQGQENSICALKGSSVDLPCSAERPTSGNKWYTVENKDYEYIQEEVTLDGNRVSHNKAEDSHPTLTINDLTESDANFYCCRETTDDPELCWRHHTELHVTDLQVKVIPTTEGQTVTLICNTSCPLTENPAVYIWYKNREFLYEDWSPWYHQLVSSEEAVTYSCAIKGYEHLRAPEVSVDSVTSTCFTVTYAEGRMCPDRQTPCTITYPREVQVQRDSTTLTCTTSCPLTDPEPAYRWYSNRHITSVEQQLTATGSAEGISCAVNGLEDLLSAEFCFANSNCLSVNYVRRRICALRGSSVNITSEYTPPHDQQPTFKSWFKINKNGKKKPVKLTEAAPHGVEFYDNVKNQHILRINKLEKDDSAEYTFKLKRPNGGWKESDFPGVTLVVTGLTVGWHPAEVTEGQNVTLSCITSCPLPDNTIYIWYLNSRPLTEPRKHNKTLILHSVSSQHAGSYSCAVEGITSDEKTLTVKNVKQKETAPAAAAAAGVCIVLLVIILVIVFLWIRKKRTPRQSPETEAMDNTEQLNHGHVYDDISTQPAEQDELQYSRVQFSKTQPETLYSTVQPHQPQQQEHDAYATVNFSPNTTSE